MIILTENIFRYVFQDIGIVLIITRYCIVQSDIRLKILVINLIMTNRSYHLRESEEKQMSEENTNETLSADEMTKEQNPAKSDGPKKFSGKKWGIIGAVIVVLIALTAGISIYNTPENRLSRQLDLGNRYLEEQNYEQAVIAFEQAIAIDDRCMEAYVGGIEAYQALGDAESCTTLYEKALTAAEKLDENELAESMDDVVEIYLAADEIYSDSPEKAIEILEAGLVKTGNNGQVKEKLVADYLDLASQQAGGANYDNALEIYDRLLELDGENPQIQSDLGNCLQRYLEQLIGQGRYDEAKALIAKYQGKVHTVDFQTYLDRIAELERVETENQAFLQKVYDLMASGNYEEMRNVDSSEEAAVFMARMVSASGIYVPEGNGSQTGMGAGVYSSGNGRLYYYGNYDNGSRSGTGTCFINSVGGGYEVFSGQWQGDVPNGSGTVSISNGTLGGSGGGYTGTYSGNLVNGLFDGAVDYKVYADDTYDLSFTAINGVPQEDAAEGLLAGVESAVDLGEGQIVFAFDHHGDRYVWQSCSAGETLGVMNLTFPSLSVAAPRQTVPEESARTSESTSAPQEPAASGDKYSYDEIPEFIKRNEPVRNMAFMTWTPEQRKMYGEMYEQLWGYYPSALNW